jgi:hypothetical protein
MQGQPCDQLTTDQSNQNQFQSSESHISKLLLYGQNGLITQCFHIVDLDWRQYGAFMFLVGIEEAKGNVFDDDWIYNERGG